MPGSPRTIAELEAEITDLRARLARAEKTIDRLLSEPPKVEVHKEVVWYPMPYQPIPTIPAHPWWEIPKPVAEPWWTSQPGTITVAGTTLAEIDPTVWAINGGTVNAGCAPSLLPGSIIWNTGSPVQ